MKAAFNSHKELSNMPSSTGNKSPSTGTTQILNHWLPVEDATGVPIQGPPFHSKEVTLTGRTLELGDSGLRYDPVQGPLSFV